MAQRAVSLRYHGLKVAQAIAVISQQLSTAGGSLPVALAKGIEAYKRQLTSVMVLAGVAMAPTFNSPKRAAAKDQQQADDSVEHLLLRLIPRPSAKTIFTDDVVAFTRYSFQCHPWGRLSKCCGTAGYACATTGTVVFRCVRLLPWP